MNTKKNIPHAPTRIALATSLALLTLSGCVTLPEAFTREEIKATAAEDFALARKDVAPLTAPLTLEEAIARGLKYNLDHRTRMLEQALAGGQLDAGRYDMLPKVLASAGYQSRNKSSNSYAPQPGGDGPSDTEAPVSADNTHSTSDLGLSWNILDFGVSYYTSKQNADRVLVAAERRRKAMHQLIQNIRTAFWKVASAQRLQAEVAQTIRESETALEDSRKVSLERVKAPVEALRFQRNLLENLRTLEGIERDLAAARIELAQLINVPPGTDFKIAEPASFALDDRLLGANMERLEELAITNNADLREQFYSARIAAVETRKALLRLFPAITLNYTDKRDSNSFLVNKHWTETAAQLSFNLINLLSGPSQMDVAEAGARLAEHRRSTMQMAILAQLHLARQDFDTAQRQFKRADAIWDVDNKLFEYTARGEAEKTQSQLSKIASRTSAILSQLRRYEALSRAHAAASRLQATLGLEPRIGNLDELSLTEVRQLIEAALRDWQKLSESEPPAQTVATQDQAVDVRQPAPPKQVEQTEEAEQPVRQFTLAVELSAPPAAPAEPEIAAADEAVTQSIPPIAAIETTPEPSGLASGDLLVWHRVSE